MPPPRFGPRPRASGYGSSTLQPLPLVTTLSASALADTSAFLNGSVNVQGLSGSWWFAWGTSDAVLNNVTPATAVEGILTWPHTVGVTIEHLTIGQTYWFALVGRSVAGTVYGTTLSFVAQTPPAVTTVVNPIVPVGQIVDQPHLSYPLVIRNTGADVTEQGSLAEVYGCVQAIVDCQEGACHVLPGFGVPDLTFSRSPLDAAQLTAAIQLQEPRAEETAVTSALRNDPDTGDWRTNLTTTSAGASSP